MGGGGGGGGGEVGGGGCNGGGGGEGGSGGGEGGGGGVGRLEGTHHKNCYIGNGKQRTGGPCRPCYEGREVCSYVWMERRKV